MSVCVQDFKLFHYSAQLMPLKCTFIHLIMLCHFIHSFLNRMFRVLLNRFSPFPVFFLGFHVPLHFTHPEQFCYVCVCNVNYLFFSYFMGTMRAIIPMFGASYVYNVPGCFLVVWQKTSKIDSFVLG